MMVKGDRGEWIGVDHWVGHVVEKLGRLVEEERGGTKMLVALLGVKEEDNKEKARVAEGGERGWMKEESSEEQGVELVVVSVTSYRISPSEQLWRGSILIFCTRAPKKCAKEVDELKLDNRP